MVVADKTPGGTETGAESAEMPQTRYSPDPDHTGV